jgi:acyl dehydratase
MELQITLYAALVSIDVPHDKAREVVRALERDMTTFGATKSDILPLHVDTMRTACEGHLEARMHQPFAL